MTATRTLLFLITAFFILSCDNDDDRAFTNDNGQFVRFFLQLNQNNQPIEAPEIEPGLPAVSVFNKSNVSLLKIPVAITSEPLTEPVTITYDVVTNGINNLEITPQNALTFEGAKLVDTVYVKINERWNTANNPSLKLTLNSSSNPAIAIGMPNPEQPLNEITINFSEFELNYGITSSSRVDVVGTTGETHDITIGFPNGYIESEVTGVNLLEETQSNYNYTIEQLPLTDSREITYRFTIDEDFMDDDLLYKTSFALGNLPGYVLDGNPSVSLLRDPITPRDITLNTASTFYDTSNNFYRLFGVNWMDFNEDGICEWRDFNTFTIPVEVAQDDPNAVLGDDMGTPDPSDDVYYHAFRVGFKPPNSNTTNSFNMRRWFTNESTSFANSPGLNVNPALEFYPDNGTSATSGTVQVIDQTIQIGTTAANGGITEFISISGSGTYSEISPGVSEIILTLNATNNRLFGGTRVAKYHLYNTNSFTDPPLLTEPCFVPIAL